MLKSKCGVTAVWRKPGEMQQTLVITIMLLTYEERMDVTREFVHPVCRDIRIIKSRYISLCGKETTVA